MQGRMAGGQVIAVLLMHIIESSLYQGPRSIDYYQTCYKYTNLTQNVAEMDSGFQLSLYIIIRQPHCRSQSSEN